MEKAAILHYMDGNYSFMNEKGEYVFRLRTKARDFYKVIGTDTERETISEEAINKKII